ncbi:MAG: co-chaperone GroES [Selenomonadaceae bacterium]|nr:co-chaperone GroES [Selenomonadaceae bacterium]
MIKPLGERIVVEVQEKASKTESGLFLPDTAKEKPQEGIVLAVGGGKVLESGAVAPMEIKVGDRVLFAKYTGNEVKVDDKNLLIIRQADILGIIE